MKNCWFSLVYYFFKENLLVVEIIFMIPTLILNQMIISQTDQQKITSDNTINTIINIYIYI